MKCISLEKIFGEYSKTSMNFKCTSLEKLSSMTLALCVKNPWNIPSTPKRDLRKEIIKQNDDESTVSFLPQQSWVEEGIPDKGPDCRTVAQVVHVVIGDLWCHV